jgi:lipoyl(octanoyl) transferase
MLFERLVKVLDPEPHSAALNMAIDEALLSTATQPLLRIYRWRHPAVSFGYFGTFASVAQDWPDRECVRRWTGGGVVPHGDDLTYSLVAPRDHPFASVGPLESYYAIHAAISDWLRTRGVQVSLAPGAPKQSDACFANPAPHDVLLGFRKIAGAAQRRTRLGLLHQGSIQGVPHVDQWRDSFESAFSTAIESRPLSEAESSLAADLVARKYGRDDWLRRV